MLVGRLEGGVDKSAEDKINPENSVLGPKKKNELQSLRCTDLFFWVFFGAWAVRFLDCEMKHKSCQRLLDMCLALDTGEVEQMCIVLSTCKGAAWGEEYGVLESYF
jgi:hypothetical protein